MKPSIPDPRTASAPTARRRPGRGGTGGSHPVVAGSTTFDVNYRLPAVVIVSRLQATTCADRRENITARVPMLRADRLIIFEEFLADPGQFHVNLHTTLHPGGEFPGQLRRRRAR